MVRPRQRELRLGRFPLRPGRRGAALGGRHRCVRPRAVGGEVAVVEHGQNLPLSDAIPRLHGNLPELGGNARRHLRGQACSDDPTRLERLRHRGNSRRGDTHVDGRRCLAARRCRVMAAGRRAAQDDDDDRQRFHGCTSCPAALRSAASPTITSTSALMR
jgi:hypothetical protein